MQLDPVAVRDPASRPVRQPRTDLDGRNLATDLRGRSGFEAPPIAQPVPAGQGVIFSDFPRGSGLLSRAESLTPTSAEYPRKAVA